MRQSLRMLDRNQNPEESAPTVAQGTEAAEKAAAMTTAETVTTAEKTTGEMATEARVRLPQSDNLRQREQERIPDAAYSATQTVSQMTAQTATPEVTASRSAAESGGCAVLDRTDKPKPKAEERPEDPNDRMRRVCFVCTGNTCRSPMAAAVANAMASEPLAKLPESLRELGRPELEAYSAGLAAGEGDPIAANAVKALEAAGVPTVPGQDYRKHTAHTLCEEEAERYDLLIAMSRQHALGLLMRFPQLAGRITTLGEDVPDPYGGSEQDYQNCLAQIIRLVRALLFPDRQ